MEFSTVCLLRQYIYLHIRSSFSLSTSQAISQNQHLMIPSVGIPEENTISTLPFRLTEDADEADHQYTVGGATPSDVAKLLLESLPRNLHWDKQEKARAQKSSSGAETESSKLMETFLEEGDEDEEDEETVAKASEEGLKIAWQYRKDVQRERLGADASNTSSRSSTSDIYCHSYDLSGRLRDQKQDLQSHVSMEPIQCCDHPTLCHKSRTCGFRLYQRLLLQLQNVLASHPRKVVRLLLYRRDPNTLCVALPLLLAYIRSKHVPVVVLVSLQPWTASPTTSATAQSSLLALRRASDVVLQAEGFAARSIYPPPAEFRHLHGLLLIRKVSTVTAATAIDGGHYADLTISKRPPANIYGLKRDRRKLNIPLLHIPPEDHAEGGGSVGGGGVRSGAGRPPASSSKSSVGGCASSGGASPLDF